MRRETFKEIWERAEVNAVLHALRAWGPRKLVAAARAAGLADDLPSDYLRDNACDACYNLMASARLAAFLTSLNSDPAFKEETAYARVYYLGETAMAARLGLTAGNRSAAVRYRYRRKSMKDGEGGPSGRIREGRRLKGYRRLLN